MANTHLILGSEFLYYMMLSVALMGYKFTLMMVKCMKNTRLQYFIVFGGYRPTFLLLEKFSR